MAGWKAWVSEAKSADVHRDSDESQTLLDLSLSFDSHQLRTPPGLPQRVNNVLGREFAHDQSLITSKSCLDGFRIDPLNVFNASSTATVHFHDKFYVLHSSSLSVAIPACRRKSPHGKKLPGNDLSPPGNFVFPLDDLYVLGLEALGCLGDGKLYRLAFLQAAESI